MGLRTRLDVFSTALLSALGVSQLVACGGSAAGGSSGGLGSGNAGTGGASPNTAGTNSGNTGLGGSGLGGSGLGGSGLGGGADDVHGGASNLGGYGQGAASTAGNQQGGASSAGAPSSGGAGMTLNRFPCRNPKDLGNGLVQCDGFKHRQKAQTCASHVPRPDSNPYGTQCKSDAECTEKAHGFCGTDPSSGEGTVCQYGCISSDECKAGELCECGDAIGTCKRANCMTDADCGIGFLCRDYETSVGCGTTNYWCQSAADACGTDADCTSARCGHDQTQNSFQCTTRVCASGRPFLIEGVQGLARVATRADWHELGFSPHGADLDSALRARLAEQWARIALMEHASIAAFARFTLQLMSLGAPASLIERATAAMTDETKHAKACFAVASGYAASALGPGRLSVERSLDESGLEAIVLNTIREGCVGETVAAIEAREAAEYAADPARRALLLEISEDEMRHAELAYRFVQWALSQGDSALGHAVRQEFAALATAAPPRGGPLTEGDHQLLQHGVVPEALREAIRDQAVARIILPCSRALFGAETALHARSASAERRQDAI